MRFETSGTICMESFKDHPQLGRFTLRDEGKQLKVVVFFIEFVFVSVWNNDIPSFAGKTIAIGKVLKIIN